MSWARAWRGEHKHDIIIPEEEVARGVRGPAGVGGCKGLGRGRTLLLGVVAWLGHLPSPF